MGGALIISEENRKYLTGFSSSDGVLVVTGSGSVFFTDSRYIEAAKKQITDCEVTELKDLKLQLPELCKSLGVDSLGIEAERMTVDQLNKFSKSVSGVNFSSANTVDNIINSMRSVKDENEVKCIAKAQEIAEKAFDIILNYISVGRTERDIAIELDHTMLKNGAEDISFKTIVVSGVNSSMPHGVPSDKKIESGDFITMDFGAVYNGYHSDMTRTVAVGSVSDRQKTVYDTVLTAQKKAISVLKEGLACAEADKAARDIIDAAGFKENFGHGTGHGVGIEIHEKPSLSPKSKETLYVGNVVTVEPGIYIPGEFGVRIEDMLLITPDGYKNFTSCNKEIIIL
ncbi:MAG: aminopeptidase P family protein [Clostridiales bacterium]|nr:aminopeptidase P family protein [Clostridiales bacterium]